MDRIYFDQAATSFPKGKGVVNAMTDYMTNVGSNIGRGSYHSAYETAFLVFEIREKLCRFFDAPEGDMAVFTENITYALNMVIGGFLKKGDHVLVSAMEHNAVMRPLVQMQSKGEITFTENITYALNMVIGGFLKKGDHVLVSAMEHNAVMRPLVQMQSKGEITFSRIPCDRQGQLMLSEIEPLIQENTKAVIMTHASNVCGTIMPLESVGKIAKEHKLVMIVDTAQTAGSIPISMQQMNIDILAFTGHKGLLGPQGIGGFILSQEMADRIDPIISGGTGSMSDLEEIPAFLPDKFEAGTLNISGILGLGAGIDDILETGILKIQEKESKLTERFIEGVKALRGIRCVGLPSSEGRTAVVSLQSDQVDASMVAFELDRDYGIMTRVGMHCAPNAHKVLGTFPKGTLRFSFGYSNTIEEIDQAVTAMKNILR